MRANNDMLRAVNDGLIENLMQNLSVMEQNLNRNRPIGPAPVLNDFPRFQSPWWGFRHIHIVHAFYYLAQILSCTVIVCFIMPCALQVILHSFLISIAEKYFQLEVDAKFQAPADLLPCFCFLLVHAHMFGYFFNFYSWFHRALFANSINYSFFIFKKNGA